MKKLRKVIILILLFTIVSIPLKAYNMPDVYHQEMFELRGSWVSTVSNIDFEKQSTIEQYKINYNRILDTFESFNMNAVFFQLRPTNDAFYVSEINPWSRFLTGVEGRDPGWDPLEWMLEVTHARGMEFHAWLNPYRASLDVFSREVDGYLKGISGSLRDVYYQKYLDEIYTPELQSALGTLNSKNFAKKNPDYLIQGGLRILLNPALVEVREHIYETILEIVENYDVDAIHFDDYFYNDVSLDSDKQLFLSQTGASTYDLNAHKDWRRANVDALIEGIHNLLEDFNGENNRSIQFGISPASGWAPAISSTCSASGYGMEEGMEGYPCNGYSSYHDLFADTRKWVKEEWIDYILPQNYFELTRYHEEVSDWWSRTVRGTKVRLYMGLGPYQFNNYNYLTENEYINQLRFNNQYDNISGFVLFSTRNLVSPNSTKMINSNNLIKSYWTRTPLLPVLLTAPDVSPSRVKTPSVFRKSNSIVFNINSLESEAGYAIYRTSYNSALELNKDNIYKLIANTDSNISFIDDVDNNKTYTYYLKNISKSGKLSEDFVRIDFPEIFKNTAPTIQSFLLPESNVYAVGDSLYLSGVVSDDNDDILNAELFYSFDGNRYRYSYPIEIINGKFSFEFIFMNHLSNNAHFKLEVSDGSDTSIAYSKNLYVVASGVGYLERHLYVVKNEMEEIFSDIFSRD